MFTVKVGLPLDGNEFAAVDHVDNVRLGTLDEVWECVRANIRMGYRVNVYKGIQHIGTFEEN